MTPTKAVTYEEILIEIHKKIIARYGSIVKYVTSGDASRAGLTSKEVANLRVYLSLPKEGEVKTSKSFPVLKKLCKKWLGYDLTQKVEYTRTVTLYI